jgi:hypothetical protein
MSGLKSLAFVALLFGWGAHAQDSSSVGHQDAFDSSSRAGLDPATHVGFTDAKSLAACIESIQRGLQYFCEMRGKYEATRDYIDSVMSAPAAEVLPTQVQAILKPREIRDKVDMQDIEAAAQMLKEFRDKPEEADGLRYAAAAKNACDSATAPLVDPANSEAMQKFYFQNYLLVASPKARAELAILKINGKWSQVREPRSEDLKKLLGSYGYSKSLLQASIDQKKLPLTPDQYRSILVYTGSYYEQINRILRNQAEDPDAVEKYRPYLDSTNSGLSQLPNYIGTVRRGGTLPDKILVQHKVGAVVEYPAYTSTSYGNGFGGQHKFVIQSYTGKNIVDISAYGDGEKEVLFRPGARFKIIHIDENQTDSYGSKSTVFYMEEVAE